MRFDESHFTCQCEKEDKKAKRFRILHFSRSFSSDITAVKGLKAACVAVMRSGLSGRALGVGGGGCRAYGCGSLRGL